MRDVPGDLLPLRIGDRVWEIGIRAEALTDMWTKKIIDYHTGDVIRLPEVFLPTFCRQPFGAARNLLVWQKGVAVRQQSANNKSESRGRLSKLSR